MAGQTSRTAADILEATRAREDTSATNATPVPYYHTIRNIDLNIEQLIRVGVSPRYVILLPLFIFSHQI